MQVYQSTSPAEVTLTEAEAPADIAVWVMKTYQEMDNSKYYYKQIIYYLFILFFI